MAETPPKRLRAQDVIDAQQQTIRNLTERHTSGSPQVAVDFTRNAKGDTQIAVKVTANMDADLGKLAAHAAEVRRIAQTTYDAAAADYPPSA